MFCFTNHYYIPVKYANTNKNTFELKSNKYFFKLNDNINI